MVHTCYFIALGSSERCLKSRGSIVVKAASRTELILPLVWASDAGSVGIGGSDAHTDLGFGLVRGIGGSDGATSDRPVSLFTWE